MYSIELMEAAILILEELLDASQDFEDCDDAVSAGWRAIEEARVLRELVAEAESLIDEDDEWARLIIAKYNSLEE